MVANLWGLPPPWDLVLQQGPRNRAPTVSAAFVISGTPSVGETLTKTAGAWSGADSVEQNWQRDGVDIVGATGDTYETHPVFDVNTTIRLRSTATNSNGSTTAYSNELEIGA